VIERFENRPPSQLDDFWDFPAQVSNFPGRLNTYVDGIRRVRSDFGIGKAL
jgi:hypothetical protein